MPRKGWRSNRRIRLFDMPQYNVAPDPYMGQCDGCGEWRSRSECRQETREETCVYVCQACGGIVDESAIPF